MKTEILMNTPSPRQTWIKTQIGQRLRLCRVRLGMSQVEAAKWIEVTKEHLSMVERGCTHPSLDMLTRAAEVYGTELVDFFLFSALETTSDTDDQAEVCGQLKHDFAKPLITGAGVWTMDYASGRDFWSAGLRRMLGFSEKIPPGMAAFLRVVPSGETARVKRFLSSLRDRKRPRPLTCGILREDGHARHCFLLADQLEDESDIPDQARLVLLDITEWEALRCLMSRNDAQLTQLIEDKTSALRQAVAEAQRELRLRRAAEQTAESRKAQLQQVLAAVPAILYSLAPTQGGIEWHSPHIQRILGFSRRELHAAPLLWHDSIHPEDLPSVDEAMALASQGKAMDVEYRIQGRDGQWRWLHDRAEAFRDASGQVNLAGVAVNITGAKLAAEALEQSREMFQAVAEDMPALVCRYAPGCIITYVNEAYCRFFGKTRAELEGTSFLDLMPEDARTPFLTALGTLTPEQPTISTEHHVYGHNNELRWHGWTDRAIFDARGQVTAYQSIGEDITESKLAREALERLSREYETILNTTHCSIFLISVDDQNRLVFERLNPREEELTGLTTEAIRGKTPVEALGLEIGGEVERNYRRCLERKQIISYEETLALPGGERTWLTQIAPVLNGDKVVKIVGSSLDITERVKAEQEHRRENERLWRENELLRQENERLRRLLG
jgi:PAS domain S-box-containing protein